MPKVLRTPCWLPVPLLSIRSRLRTARLTTALGGSATFFCYAASFFTPPRLVGVVGEDFPDEHRRLFDQRGIDTAGLVTQPGKTFRWKGRYHQDMNTRDTLEVHLNVFGTFDPELPDAFATARTSSWPTAAPTSRRRCSTRSASRNWSWPTRWTCGSTPSDPIC